MEELWSFLPPVECATHTLEDLAVNRDRVALITHPNYFDGREEAAAAAHAANSQLRKKAKAPPPRPAQPYRLYPLNDEQLALNFPAWQVLAQLEMRGVRVGRTTAVQNLRELWKTNSNLPCLPAFAAAAAAVVEPIFALAPHVNIEEMRIAQNAQPITPTRPSRGGSAAVSPLVVARVAAAAAKPPRRRRKVTNQKSTAAANADCLALSDDDTSGAAALLASAPSTPQHQNPQLTPRRQAVLRQEGKAWLNL